MRTLLAVQQELPSTPETGLSPEQVARSRQQHGSNGLTPMPREPLWKKFIEKFDEAIIKILLAAALLSMFVDLFKVEVQVAAGCFVVVALLLVGLFVRKQQYWIPTSLFGSAIVLFFIGLITGHLLAEGLAVMIAVILATGVAFASEYKSDREFEVLNAQKDKIQVKVLRGGNFQTILLEEVVVGEQIVLEMGDEIPADGRLIKATDLYIDQSLMTGESEPVHKRTAAPEDTAEGPEQAGCVYRGTQVVDGVGQMVVTDVGDHTYLGQIARRLSTQGGDDEDEETEGPETEEKRVKKKLTISKELTPLQLKLTNLADLISKVGYIAAIAIFAALLIMRGILGGELSPSFKPPGEEDVHGWLGVARALLDYFVVMVIVIVVAVPEGLPMSVTVSLALAMQKMTRANSLVRQLVACETIGSATVICSDKTGTLTQNKMQVVRLFFDGKTFEKNSPDWIKLNKEQPIPQDGGKPIDWLVLNSGVNSTANLEMKDGKLLTVGNSTEGSLLFWLHESGVEYQQLRLKMEPIYQVHFSSERKRMTSVVKHDGKLVALVKGAPEWVLENSKHYQAADGSTRPWTPEAKAAVASALKDSASQAMRTLGFGFAALPPHTPENEDELHTRRDSLESDLVFVGFVAIRDPLREDVKEAVDQCRRAGIEVKMITGDNVETARAIAYDIGLVNDRATAIDADGGIVFTSPKFNELFEKYKQLKSANPDGAETKKAQDALANLRVLARARPLDKYKMVELLQDRNEVVAMTGDGTNDAPSLKKADVGLAMGIAGTEVAKEASKIVLLDDAFSTIVKAVNWGRSLYENIQRFIQFQLTINVSALVIAFLAALLGPILGIQQPFTVLQFLWINVIMDTFAAIALCSEPPRASVMNQRPKRRDENIVTPSMSKTILVTAGFYVVVMMGLLLAMKHTGLFARADEKWSVEDIGTALSPTQAGVFFSIYVFFQFFNLINCRSLVPQESGLKNLLSNKTFLGIVGAIAVVQFLITEVPFMAEIFKVGTLDWMEWLWVLLITPTVLIFAEVARRIRLATEAKAASTTS